MQFGFTNQTLGFDIKMKAGPNLNGSRNWKMKFNRTKILILLNLQKKIIKIHVHLHEQIHK